MLNKFMFLINHSLKKKFKSKAFIIANVVLFLIIIAISNINNIISFFGGDFNKESNIYIIDNTGYDARNTFEEDFLSLSKTIELDTENKIKSTDETYDAMVKKIEDTNNIIIEFDKDENNYIKAKVVSVGYIDTVLYQVIYQSLNSTKYKIALQESGIDKEEFAKISAQISTERILLDENKKSEEENMEMIMGVVFPTVILPFYILIILLVQIIGGEINEEKQTRSMEVIISNVTPKTHFFSKILSANIFVVVQTLLLFIYGLIGLGIKNLFGNSAKDLTGGMSKGISSILDSLKESGFMDKLVYIIPLAIILMLLSFLAYSLFAGILASMTVSMEDYQQIQTPIMLVCVSGYLLSIMAGSFEGSTLIKFLSYVPFISCLLSPALLVIGQIGIIDVIISIVVLIALDYVFVKYGMKIYKIGILNYSTDKMWSRLFKAVKAKN